MQPQTIHAILICYNNPEQTLVRWKRDMVPALEVCFMEYRVTVIDNSATESGLLKAEFGEGYLWQQGNNLQYGPSINLAVKRIPSDFILYCCSRHGKAFHNGWAFDLIRPMVNEPTVGGCGHLMGSNSPEGVAHDTKCEWVKEKFRFDDGVKMHLQGGVFAARTAAMLQNPYPDEIPHLYTDHILTWSLLKSGWEVRDIHTIKSVWRDTVANPEQYWFCHSENCT